MLDDFSSISEDLFLLRENLEVNVTDLTDKHQTIKLVTHTSLGLGVVTLLATIALSIAGMIFTYAMKKDRRRHQATNEMVVMRLKDLQNSVSDAEKTVYGADMD